MAVLNHPDLYDHDTSDDKPRLRTTTKGDLSFSGLNIGGLITIQPIDDSSWTALPASSLTNRNAICIQNLSGSEIKVNYLDSVGYVGVVIPTGGQRYYDITDSIAMYARAISGAGTISVTVEEIA